MASVSGLPKPGLPPFKFYSVHHHWGNMQSPKNADITSSTYKPENLAN